MEGLVSEDPGAGLPGMKRGLVRTQSTPPIALGNSFQFQPKLPILLQCLVTKSFSTLLGPHRL